MDAFNDVRSSENGIVTNRIEIPNDEINHSYNILSNINFQHNFSKDQRLNVDLDYAFFNKDNPSNYTNRFYDVNDILTEENELRVATATPMDIWVGKLDYSNTLNEKLILELGLKATNTQFENDVQVENNIDGEWTVAPLFSSLANLSEKIMAAYSSLSINLSEKTDMKLGLRYEFTDSNLSTEEESNLVDREYGNLFPSLFLTNKINDNNSIQFSYSRRISRPSFRQLAPFFIFYDPSTVLTGNPKLQPATSDAIRLTYIWKTLQLGLQYTYTTDLIGRWQPEVDLENNTQVNGAKNFPDGI